MSPSRVSRITRELIDAGVLDGLHDEPPERPGRPTQHLRLRADAAVTIGVEAGGGQTRLVACDAHGEAIAEDVRREGGPIDRALLDRLVRRVKAFVAKHRLPEPAGVGAALHHVVTSDGHWQPKEHGGGSVPARRILEERLDVPVRVDDVSRAFADAEHRFGAGRNAPDMLYLFLGRDGVGSGIFADGNLIRSRTGICGEIGHVSVRPDGERCRCGNVGCLETLATHEALIAHAEAYLAQGVDSELRPGATFSRFTEAARRGDKVATLVVHELNEHLARALTSAISVTGATTIVLGGDVRATGDTLPNLLSETLRMRLLRPLGKRLHVTYAALPANAGARGAAVGVLDDILRDGSLVRRRLPRARPGEEAPMRR
ncbi:MAG: ROK family protein [Trueperaceae bacterium]|nr:ROK family protein [Trueperaceae bacterium]